MKLDDSYRLGADRALEVLGWAKVAGVRDVTLFGLSCENLEKRKSSELEALLVGANYFLDQAFVRGYRLHVFGDIDTLATDGRCSSLVERVRSIPPPTDDHDFTVHVGMNYSGGAIHELEPLFTAIERHGLEEVRKNRMRYLLSASVPSVDLVIRTGAKREKRTSGLLPFQTGYAELRFVNAYWGNFTEGHFHNTLQWYARQERNFGK